MVKSIRKIFIVMLIVVLAFGMICLNYSYAAEATISVGSAKVNQDFTVTVNIPSDAVAYEGKIEVTFSNGTTLSSGKLSKVTGLDGNFTHPGNMTATFKAPAEGGATVKVTGLIISGRDAGQLNSQTSLEQGFNVEAEAPAPQTPATPAAPTTPSTPATPAPTTNNDPGYTATGDTVYALEKLNVRDGASTNSNKIGSLAKNTSVKRISVGDNGWDKIEYNGGVGYVSSKWLTTKNPNGDTTNTTDTNNTTNNTVPEPKWTPTGDTVYSKKSLNVREGWGTSFKSIGGLIVGEKTTRIAVGDNGWDKIKYEGKEAYVMSKYLTTSKKEVDKIREEMEANKVENNTIVENNTVAENTVNNTVVENVVTNEEIYNTIVEEIGVIPQVGKSTAYYVYIAGVITSIVLVCIVGLKIRSKE